MSFIHDEPEFDALLRIVAGDLGLSLGLVEKDYWVAHALWGLIQSGFSVWFKGGTSLSKGFSLITRFSEDLDLKIEPGSVPGILDVTNWQGQGKPAIQARAAYFAAIRDNLSIPGANVVLNSQADAWQRAAEFRVEYPGGHLNDLAGLMRPFVLLEVGSARVTPALERPISSFVHDHLERQGMSAEFTDNRPIVRCVHPLVTLLEKLDALSRRVLRDEVEPAAFVRHYEDLARIIQGEGRLPPLEGYADVRELAAEMLRERQIRELPRPTAPAFGAQETARESEIQASYAAIAPMFWGERLTLEFAREVIREWLERWF